MERLTYTTEHEEALFHPEDLPEDTGMTIIQLAKDGRFKALGEIAEKLTAYEDTGITPEQIREIDRLYAEKCKELAGYKQAEEQGLLLQLPCKVGGKIWDNGFGRPYSYIVTGFSIGRVEEDGCGEMTVYYQDLIGVETGCFAVDEIGKTVFLTKSEAEQALAEKGGVRE